MGLTVGGSGLNASSMLAAPATNSNMGMYAPEQDKGNGPGQNGEFD
jgi:hypothetical protein